MNKQAEARAEVAPISRRRAKRYTPTSKFPAVRGETREGRLRRAEALGCRWAETKESWLEGSSPSDWPDTWAREWGGDTSELRSAGMDPIEYAELVAYAHCSASVRWGEIIDDRRAREDLRSMHQEADTRANRLAEELATDLPHGLSVARDGSHVCVVGDASEREEPVRSVAEASRVVGEWRAHASGR
jgi:hypothetical protein